MSDLQTIKRRGFKLFVRQFLFYATHPCFTLLYISRFEGSEGYFKLVNHVSNPHHMTEILFPLLSIVDSVFAAQLLLCMAFGGWLNAVMKW